MLFSHQIENRNLGSGIADEGKIIKKYKYVLSLYFDHLYFDKPQSLEKNTKVTCTFLAIERNNLCSVV